MILELIFIQQWQLWRRWWQKDENQYSWMLVPEVFVSLVTKSFVAALDFPSTRWISKWELILRKCNCHPIPLQYLELKSVSCREVQSYWHWFRVTNFHVLSSILSYPILSNHTLFCFRSNNTGQLVLLRHWLRHGHRHWTWSQESKVTNSPSSLRPLSSTISSAINKICFQIKTKTPPPAKPTSLLWISGQRGSWLPQHFTWRGKWYFLCSCP